MHADLFQTGILGRIERRGTIAHSDARLGALARWTIGVPMKFTGNGEIYGESEAVDYIYEVANGTVRTVKTFSDGRRQIGGFYFAGDIFGLEEGSRHSYSAEAIVDSNIRFIKRSVLIRMAGDDRELAQQLLIATAGQIARLHNHALMLARTAEERLGSFLLEMAERISTGDLIELPMTRQDIADYLGMTIETVSRTFTILASRSAIEFSSPRAVILRDRSALAGL